MKRILLMLLCALPVLAQTRAEVLAESMLAEAQTARWGEQYSSARKGNTACGLHVPEQMALYATEQWTHSCHKTGSEVIRESFYYVFGEPARTALLRVDVRPTDESPQFTADLLRVLRAKLIARFGPPQHAPALTELGFRPLRYGRPVADDHWKAGRLHYYLHANQSASSPMGVRRGVQLLVLHERLVQERTQDAFILQVDVLGDVSPEHDPAIEILSRNIGERYTRAVHFKEKTQVEREQAARRTSRDVLSLLDEASRSSAEEKAMKLLAADALVSQLTGLLYDSSSGRDRESALAPGVRRSLARYGIKLGGMTHYGGLEYHNDLLWRVWREHPDTEAGELAFLKLQRRGWNTDPREGCPKNPDLFRKVIERGESFLARRPETRFRKEILYTLAVANESWWSIAHAPPGDAIVSAPPYPRGALNAARSAPARDRAIRYYREIVQFAPESAEAASARRRLPRLELGLDTGQRRFFCFYC
jgi:hypothetical protein